MTPLFKKLNFKDQNAVLSLNYPESFRQELSDMASSTSILTVADEADTISFCLIFVTKPEEINQYMAQIAPKLVPDAVLWFCYPKGSSKKYTSALNRDHGWSGLAAYNLEPVRQVAIDDDWSALRFRNVDHIKKITRRESFAFTESAKNRTTQKGI